MTDPAGLTTALEKIVSEVGASEVVVYNAARNSYVMLGQYSPTDILEEFKVPKLGLGTTASVLLPHLQALAKSIQDAYPALFVTSGAIIHQPFAPVFSLSMAKAEEEKLGVWNGVRVVKNWEGHFIVASQILFSTTIVGSSECSSFACRFCVSVERKGAMMTGPRF